MNNDLSIEQINDTVTSKAAELSTKLNLPVIGLCFKHVDQWIVGYVKKPNRMTVRQAIDRMEKFGKLDAGDLILQTCLIREESDSRIVDMNPEYDGINNGACLEVLSLVEISLSVIKKNTTNI